MPQLIQAVRGMNDILPPDTYLWQHTENIIKRCFQSYGYQEIRFPIVEKTELFKRSIGEATDIVEKEMYTFIDRNGESLTLRPEGTASCVRAALEHGLIYNQIRRLWYAGAYFRHERPQKGRYRQFYQYAAEVFGLDTPDIDAELIALSAFVFDQLGIKSEVKLQLNTLGTPQSRAEYRTRLVKYFTSRKQHLDEDSLKRLDKNPLRILDSKNPALKEIIENAPKLSDYLDKESSEHFEKLQSLLKLANIEYETNPFLVRGLDYYTKTVFEWVTDKLGAQGTVCAGGRYDGLVEQLGGKSTPALGFAIGMERTVLLMQQRDKHQKHGLPHAYIVTDSDEAFAAALRLANYLRNRVHGLRILLHCGGGPLKNQFKKADKSEAMYAIIIGEREVKMHAITLKNLREDIPQQTLHHDELAEFLKLKIKK